jgi:hypothetical protein
MRGSSGFTDLPEYPRAMILRVGEERLSTEEAECYERLFKEADARLARTFWRDVAIAVVAFVLLPQLSIGGSPPPSVSSP